MVAAAPLPPNQFSFSYSLICSSEGMIKVKWWYSMFYEDVFVDFFGG